MPDSAVKKAWIKENTVTWTLRLNKHTDADIIARVDVPGRHGELKKLIRLGMECEKRSSGKC